jgi:hypothetical protein
LERGCPFVGRQRLYARLDAEFAADTRFFAAAALINSVLARVLFWAPRGPLRHALLFLREAGAVLESANLQFAREIRGSPGVPALDLYLVTREQKLMQTLLEAEVRRGIQGTALIREVNGLLNGDSMAGMISRLINFSRPFTTILATIRRETALVLDFSDETHRVQVGLGIIRHIRRGAVYLPDGCPIIKG